MILDWEVVRTIFAVAGAVAAVFLAVYVSTKKIKAVGEKAVREEWRDLAMVRAAKIDELEARANLFEERISHLEGAYAALQDLKVNEIAVRIVDRLMEQRVQYEGESIEKFISALKNAGLVATLPE